MRQNKSQQSLPGQCKQNAKASYLRGTVKNHPTSITSAMNNGSAAWNLTSFFKVRLMLVGLKLLFLGFPQHRTYAYTHMHTHTALFVTLDMLSEPSVWTWLQQGGKELSFMPLCSLRLLHKCLQFLKTERQKWESKKLFLPYFYSLSSLLIISLPQLLLGFKSLDCWKEKLWERNVREVRWHLALKSAGAAFSTYCCSVAYTAVTLQTDAKTLLDAENTLHLVQ